MSVSAAAAPVESVRDRVTEVVAECLGLAATEMDPREPLALYGLDSLRSVELEALLDEAFDRPLPDDLAGNPSLDALVSVLEDGERRTRDRDAAHARALMRADGVLPFDIRPAAAPRTAPPTGRVLLTGATGFLGGHLLRTLLAETHAEVLCLVRDRGSDGESQLRVRRSLERYRLWDDTFDRRVHAVIGDLSAAGTRARRGCTGNAGIGRRRHLPRRGRRQLGGALRRTPRRQRRRHPGAASTGLSRPAQGVPFHLQPLGLPRRRRAALHHRGRRPLRQHRAAAARLCAEQVRRRGPGAPGAGARTAHVDTSPGTAHGRLGHRRLEARRPRVLALQGMHRDGNRARSRLAHRRGARRSGGTGHRPSLGNRPRRDQRLPRERAAGAALAGVRPLDEPLRLSGCSRAARPLAPAACAGGNIGRPRPAPAARLLSAAPDG